MLWFVIVFLYFLINWRLLGYFVYFGIKVGWFDSLIVVVLLYGKVFFVFGLIIFIYCYWLILFWLIFVIDRLKNLVVVNDFVLIVVWLLKFVWFG